jgi:hypothetical protein
MALVPITVISIIIVVFACQRDEHQSSQSNLTSGRTLKSVNDSGPIGVVTGNGLELIESQLNMKTIFLQNYPSLKESWMQDKLSIDTLSILYPELDTIEVKVTIFANATMKFEPQFPKDSITYDTIKIDSILHARLVDFPKVHPAIKRGIPVKTQFVLPVILKIE